MKPERRNRGAAIALLGLFMTHLPGADAQCTPREVAILAGSGIGPWEGLGRAVAVAGDTAVVGAPLDDGTGAVYVYVRDQGGPNAWGEVKRIVASDGAVGDQFGISVAISGDTVLVGAWLDDDLGSASGSAYVFERHQGGVDSWGEVKKVTAFDGAALDGFGISVAVSGDGAAVGARLDDDLGPESGSAYVLRRNLGGANGWGTIYKLHGSGAAPGDFFGHAVDVEGTRVVVGALNAQNYGAGSGSVYVFEWNTGVGVYDEVGKLRASDGAPGDQFGFSVALSGDTLAVGAPADDHAANDAGSTYVFERDRGGPEAWGQVAKVTASDAGANDGFGRVDLAGDQLLVGAPRAGTGGQAYTFGRDAGGADAWGSLAVITASNGAAGDELGGSVALSVNTALLGAPGNDVAGSNAGSAYVFDGLSSPASPLEVAKLVGDGGFPEGYGVDVAVSGDVVVVGDYLDSERATVAGAAFVYERHQNGSGSWGLVKKLLASDGSASDYFGISVAISGDTVVVGASRDDELSSSYGSAYVFARHHGGANNWGEVAKIKATDALAVRLFGRSVSVCGPTVVVGAPNADVSAVFRAGAAYVFERDQGGANQWGQVAKLFASSPATNDDFGYDVACAADTALVGSGNEAGTGAGYVFERDQGGANQWGQVVRLIGADTVLGDGFGSSVALSGDTALLGALGDDDVALSSGSAYLFERDRGGAGNWGEVTKITAADSTSLDYFGHAVSLSGDVAFVGADWADSAGTKSGAAYVFARDHGGPNNWGETAALLPSDGGADDYFGSAVAVSGVTGVASSAGPKRAYVFEPMLAVPPTTYCTAGVSASGCQALMAASGTPSASAASGFDLISTGVEGDKSGLFFYGSNGRQANTWGSGSSLQCVAPPVKRGALVTGGGTPGACDGEFVYDLNARWTALPAHNPGAGALVQAQLWYRDPFNTSNQSTSLSNAIEFSLCP